jgi:hypothetical protein
MVHIDRFKVPNGHGWLMALRRVVHPTRLDRSRAPVLIVPGYGMNLIFGIIRAARS